MCDETCTDYCETCGDCLDCYGEDPCIDGFFHVSARVKAGIVRRLEEWSDKPSDDGQT
jgi:hypothetical protein